MPLECRFVPDSRSVELRPLQLCDAGEILTLQRAAFVDEAVLFNDVYLPALTQSLPELVQEIQRSSGIVAVVRTRLAGAIRMQRVDQTLRITRLTVAPDLRGRGIGTALMRAAEEGTAAVHASLFLRPRNDALLRFYRCLGYIPAHVDAADPAAELIELRKQLR
jgi:ribosomal protein S18 acetylase RimI-like enzyme